MSGVFLDCPLPSSLRRNPTLNLELSWQPVNPKIPPISVSDSAGVSHLHNHTQNPLWGAEDLNSEPCAGAAGAPAHRAINPAPKAFVTQVLSQKQHLGKSKEKPFTFLFDTKLTT